jgi:hypothetical protein
VGCIAVAILVFTSMVGASTAVSTDGFVASGELTVETQDRVDDDGNLGSTENNDGDNVYASIQSAIDAANNGATINVTQGEYNESVTIDKPNIKLTGNTGQASAGAAGNAPVLDSNNQRSIAITLTANADHVVIEGLEIREYSSIGIFPQAGRTETSRNLTVRQNTIDGMISGVLLFSRADGATLRQHTVTRNEITNSVHSVNIGGRTGVSYIQDISVTENELSGGSADGVQIVAFNDNATISDISVRDNDIENKGTTGVQIVARQSDTEVSGVDVDGNAITNAGDALQMRAPGGATLGSVTAFHNELTDSENGTYVNATATDSVLLNYNAIEGNTNLGVVNLGNDILNARNNWWGATDGPTATGANGVSENVSYDPFLTRVVDVENATAPIGETATVDVTADAANVAGYEITVEFNESALQVEEVVGADFAGPTVNVDNGNITFTQAQSEGIDEPTLARINFNVTEAGESNVTVTSAETSTFDADGEEVSSVTYDGGVVVNDEPGNGDVNGDEQVNAGDVVLIQQYLTGQDVDIDTEAADVDGDGDVDAGDVLLIQQQLVEG